LVLGLEAHFEVGDTVRAGRGEVDFSLFDGAARVGLQALRMRHLELIPMIDARVGVIHAPSRGYTRSLESETRGAVLAGAGVLARVEIVRRLFLEALPEVELVVVREDFQVIDNGQLYGLHRAKPLAARLALGFGYEFH